MIEPCGNGQLDAGEDCDGDDFAGVTCSSLGFDGGELACATDCSFSTAACTRTERCDSGVDEDGDSLVDCEDDDCFNDAACPRCGDGRINQDSEECDGTNVPAYCADFGHTLGRVTCNDDCTLDTTGCGDPESCGSGTDEDRDGLVDCEDSDCSHRYECPVCGNGVVQQGEGCDGSFTASCTEFGFDGGALVCGSDCEFDTSACRDAICGDTLIEGAERCDDGNTLDGDGCSSVCAIEGDVCAEALALAPDATIGGWSLDGTTAGRFADYPATCADTTGVPDAVLSFTAPTDGRYYVAVEAAYDIVLRGWQDACDGQVPLRCMNEEGPGVAEGIEVEIAAGETVYFVASGIAGLPEGVANSGPFHATAVQVTCNDGIIEGWEQCEDGNTVAGDGCSPLCRWEGDTCADAVNLNVIGEEEPGTWFWRSTTQRFWPDYSGSCNTTAARDGVARFEAPASGLYRLMLLPSFDASLYLWDGACTQAASELACSSVSPAPPPTGQFGPVIFLDVNLAAGQIIYPVVDGNSTSDDVWGWFMLAIQPVACGDGVIAYLESCDDGNNVDGDGCSSSCSFEGQSETEPNDSLATADLLAVGELGMGTLEQPPAVDADYWTFNATAGQTYDIWTRDRFTGACAEPERNDTHLRLYDSAGAFVAENDNISVTNRCSRIIWTPLISGQYFVEVTTAGTPTMVGPLVATTRTFYVLSMDEQ
ncbi:DUF4215 domain-containing protein [Vulgatibacter sp.]|uniref:DUF4215 domain-containing protein n=1 Tax=Vulgatibacter sp. TaxID=1971226 RepID=UPI003562D225